MSNKYPGTLKKSRKLLAAIRLLYVAARAGANEGIRGIGAFRE